LLRRTRQVAPLVADCFISGAAIDLAIGAGGDEKSRVSHIAFTPDGNFARATRRGAATADNGKITDTKHDDITVGNTPNAMDIALRRHLGGGRQYRPRLRRQ
jgi:hypothetical protein